ncbi:MAG: hypothetical protein J6H20_05950 [Pyramidobacter sp.]|nr:hypothetical protein [Pyramidobacter sp.]
MNELANYSEKLFEDIKHINEYGEEYWLARELQTVLEYSQWRYLKEAIERAKLACKNSGYEPSDHLRTSAKWLRSAAVRNETWKILCSPAMPAT